MTNKSPEALRLELKKWQRKSKCKPNRFYFIYLIFILCLAYIVDELASNINSIMSTKIIDTFFKGTNNNFVIFTTICSAISFFSFFYKVLSDKFGRKPFLVINIFGMALGMFVCFLSKNIYIFLIGTLLMNFFTPCDMQILYVIETSLDKHRGFWMTFTKAFGVMGVVMISAFRSWAIDTMGNWQYVFLIPACFGVGAGLICLLFVDESRVFIQNKISYLKKEIKKADYPDEVESKEEKLKNKQGGIISAIKYMLLDKPLIWLFVVGLIFSIASVATGNYGIIMQPAPDIGMSDQMVTDALSIYPFAYALVELIIGIISDKLGRIRSVLISGGVTLLGFLCFVVGNKMIWPPYLIGALLGLFIGGYMTSIDLLNIICAEKSPTNLRGSILSIVNVSFSAGSLIGTGLLVACQYAIPNLDVGYFALIAIIPALFIALLLLISKMPETNGMALTLKKKLTPKKKIGSKKK